MLHEELLSVIQLEYFYKFIIYISEYLLRVLKKLIYTMTTHRPESLEIDEEKGNTVFVIK